MSKVEDKLYEAQAELVNKIGEAAVAEAKRHGVVLTKEYADKIGMWIWDNAVINISLEVL